MMAIERVEDSIRRRDVLRPLGSMANILHRPTDAEASVNAARRS
jgi:hypothetical protein